MVNLLPVSYTHLFWHQFLTVFNWNTVRENKELFWVFLVMTVYFIGFNVYFPYITIYFVNYLGYGYGMTGIIQGVGLLAAAVMTIPAARFIDKGKTPQVILTALICNMAGDVYKRQTRDNVQVVLDAGANIIVAGSAIFNGNIAENVKNMMEILAPGPDGK